MSSRISLCISGLRLLLWISGFPRLGRLGFSVFSPRRSVGRAAGGEVGVAVPIAAGGASRLRSRRIMRMEAQVEADVGQTSYGSRGQWVPVDVKIRRVVVRREPVDHYCRQPIHLSVC